MHWRTEKSQGLWKQGEQFPPKLKKVLDQPGTYIHAWNALFEVCLWELVGQEKHGFPPVDRNKWRDTMALAAYFGLPLDLFRASRVVAPDTKKDQRGSYLISVLCKPVKPTRKRPWTRLTPERCPDLFQELYEYCRGDTAAEKGVHDAMPRDRLPPTEQAIWKHNLDASMTGTALDMKAVARLIAVRDEVTDRLKEEFKELVGFNPTQVAELKELIGLPNVAAQTVRDALAGDDLSPEHRRALEIRQAVSKTSTKKLDSMQAVAVDGRAHGMQVYYGAHTGRYAGRLIQLQNLPRGDFQPSEEEFGMIHNAPDLLGSMELLYDDVNSAISTFIRGCLRPSAGRHMYIADYSSIEARVLAWFAGQQDQLNLFHAGEDPYKAAAAEIYEVDIGSVSPEQRALGKTCLAEGSLLYSDRGWIPIETLKKEDMLWDGIDWCEHRGILKTGTKEVVNLKGLCLTPDHRILWSGKHWLQAQNLVHNAKVTSQALATARARLPSKAIWSAPVVGSGSCWYHAIASRIKSITWRLIAQKESLVAALSAGAKPGAESGSGNTPWSWKMMPTARAYSTGSRQPSTAATTRTLLSMITTGVGALRSARSGVQIVRLFSATSKLVKAGTSRSWRWTVQIMTRAMNQVISALSRGRKTPTTSGESGSSKMTSTVYDVLSVGSRNRFLALTNDGPLIVHNCVLGCGFQMGKNRFFDTCIEWGTPVERELADRAVDVYRGKNTDIVALWYRLNDVVMAAIRTPNKLFTCNQVTIASTGQWLIIKLPSGRTISYPMPRVDVVEKEFTPGETTLIEQATYMGLSSMTNKWERQETYGGKLVENLVQGMARDLMCEAQLRIQPEGFDFLFCVHDEIVSEADSPDRLEEYQDLMTVVPGWADGLPVSASGGVYNRFRK